MINPIAIIHGVVAIVVISLALPLIGRRVKMNAWYGVRIRASLESEARWYEINEYGGRMLLYWSALIALVASSGLFIARPYWERYAQTTTPIILIGLGVIVVAIFRHAAKTRGPG